VDGRRFVTAALEAGAASVLVEDEGVEAYGFNDARIGALPRLKAATGPIADAYYEQPSARLRVLAITGTNGKTSTAWWLAQAVTRAGIAGQGCGLIGTLGTGRPGQVRYTGHTTPDPVLLQSQFRRFADEGLGACAIEASSIGLAERRLDGTRIAVAAFTNFTQDHLDYHGSMEAYWAAKAELFDWPGLQAAVVNVDDEKGAALAEHLAARGLPLWTYACVPVGGQRPVRAVRAARLQAVDLRYTADGLQVSVCEGALRVDLATRLIGQFNVANLLAVIGCLRALGLDLAQAVSACEGLMPVPGRMECLQQAGAPLVAVDYAHTPDALAQALGALRPLAAQRGGRLWCIFGCGGDRDAIKRPLMAAVAEQLADAVLVTSDNPRSERPSAIISQILRGFTRGEAAQVEADRSRAIVQAVREADPRDVILLAGKGHETFQEVAGERLPFDDREQARAALALRAAGGVAAATTARSHPAGQGGTA
jgi:UDP-N-acetylmuramoyl-L-alanyl-D-glutamate--2,6-diaminopimelate ligase